MRILPHNRVMYGPPPPHKITSLPARIGIVGTGFIAAGLLGLLTSAPGMTPSRVLSRRNPTDLSGLVADHHTASLDQLIEESDIIVECSGDVHHAADVVDAAFMAGLPVVTMGTEFQVTVGSYFAARGYLTEAEGDQPGCLAALHEEVVGMGFKPMVYGNMKGFLNHTPTREEMKYWAGRNGISLAQVTSFTDGTKLQMEQAFVGNGLGADIATRGLLGPADMDLMAGGNYLAEQAMALGRPIADYLLNPKLPAGVFIVGEHPEAGPEVLRYLKLGDGPYYTLMRPYHLCHLEIPRTLRRVIQGGPPLLNNGTNPHLGVCAVAKEDVAAGALFRHGEAGEVFRGEAVRLDEADDLAPLGLLTGARLLRHVKAGETLRLDDVELPDTLATRVWLEMRAENDEMAAAG